MKHVAIWLVVALSSVASAAAAYPGQGIPNPRYPDGTGNDAVEELNDAQLDQNYRGPYYVRPSYQPQTAYPPAYPPAPGYPPPSYARPAYAPSPYATQPYAPVPYAPAGGPPPP
jgi:hypothetical protein